MENNLILARENILERLQNTFKDKAIECHVFGSVARGDADAYSDIDIWFTFNDGDYEEILNNRLQYYNQIGEIIHICEPPQNAPIGGIHSALFVKTNPDIVSKEFIPDVLGQSDFVNCVSKALTEDLKKLMPNLGEVDTLYAGMDFSVIHNSKIDKIRVAISPRLAAGTM